MIQEFKVFKEGKLFEKNGSDVEVLYLESAEVQRADSCDCRNEQEYISNTRVWYLIKKYFKKSRIRTSGIGPHASRAYTLVNRARNLAFSL
jgi:hypothetical protein